MFTSDFTNQMSIDTITDFTVLNSTGAPGDIIEFYEYDLGFNAQGFYPFYHASSNAPQESTSKQIIGVLDQTLTDWSNAAQVMENTLSDFGDGSNDDTYFVVNNGTNGRIYYWSGDIDGQNDIDKGELTHMADLQNITVTDIQDMSEYNFGIIEGP